MGNLRVLIVEDNLIEAKSIEYWLLNFGYHVLPTSRTGKIAIQHVKEMHPDLVLMDIKLAGEIDGIQAADKIKNNYDIPVIYITAYADEDTLKKAKITEPYGYIVKPFDENILRVTIETAYQRYKSDITLKNRELQFKDFLKFSCDMACISRVEPDGRLIPEWYDQSGLHYLTGFTSEDIFDWKSWKNIIHDEDRLIARKHFEKILSGNQDSCEYRIITKSGETVWIQTHGRPILDEETKRVVRIMSSIRNITDRKMPEFGVIPVLRDKEGSKATAKKLVHNLIYDSTIMRQIEKNIIKMSNSDANVLIFGESGTGKELIARSIHQNCTRKDHPFIPLDCVALPTSLLESELFGFERGAFTGAVKQKPGVFELAAGGTLFLDEITEMDHQLQAKLLRVIQERKFRRIGGKEMIKADVRIISATNRNPEKAVQQNIFREDLYYRLNVVPIYVPPLRERKEDVPLLVYHFIDKYHPFSLVDIKGISKEAMQCLKCYSWPGNIRELENVIQRAMSLAEHEILSKEDIPDFIYKKNTPSVNGLLEKDYKEAKAEWVQAFDREYIEKLLDRYNGNVSRVARVAGISRATLYRIMDECNIHP